ncbi:ester cyclase [Streptomyces sp. NPDC050743]|uniref:ester cyclase n=1 Tax=Streptomyces sp. NPDC050743 TaxID=3365634 RepID=UPI00378E98E3
MTSTEDLARRFYQAFDTADPALLDEVLAPDWTPQPPVPGNPGGADGQKQTLHMLHNVFQGLRYQVEEVLVAADTAAVRARLTGRQVGEFLGVPPPAVGSRCSPWSFTASRTAASPPPGTWRTSSALTCR